MPSQQLVWVVIVFAFGVSTFSDFPFKNGCTTVGLLRDRVKFAIQIEEELYQLRPMNCPFHIAVYKHKQYSYRDLPLRYAELGTVYRYERSGTMHGLFRVRGFTQVVIPPDLIP